MLSSKLKRFFIAIMLGWTLLVANPSTALARNDDEIVHYDARIQGYEPTDVELKSSTTGMAWFLFFVLIVACFLGMFKDAKRSHLD